MTWAVYCNKGKHGLEHTWALQLQELDQKYISLCKPENLSNENIIVRGLMIYI